MADWQISHLLNEAGKALRLFQALSDPVRLVTDFVGIVTMLETPPPGDPEAVDALAAAVDGARATLEGVLSTYSAQQQQAPAVMVGVAAGTAAQALAALRQGTVEEITGLQITATALRRYAETLTSAIAGHRSGTVLLDQAGHLLSQALGSDVRVFGFDTGLPDPTAVLRALPEIVGIAARGALACQAAYLLAEEGLLRLERDWSDGKGYARLAGTPVPRGFTILDVAVMDGQWRGDDPDGALLTAEQWSRIAEQMQRLSADDTARLDGLLSGAVSPAQRAAILMGLAAGADIEQLSFLAKHISGMSDADLMAMLSLGTDAAHFGSSAHDLDPNLPLDPASVDGQPSIELSATTCGSTSLLLLAAQKDPFLALWLRTGERPGGWAPDYLGGLDPGTLAGSTYAQRFSAVQQVVLAESNATGILPGSSVPWPGGLIGTSPWGASALASRTGNGAYVQTPLDDADPEQTQQLLTAAAQAANAGTPVPLYVGDGSLPRHVVLITGYSGGSFTVYDPSDGEVKHVPESEMMGDGSSGPQSAFGNWTHVDWIILPRAS